jgi:NAD(P)-dependent dehydrogenase (short-subunit alcohol dehydrogenase family)
LNEKRKGKEKLSVNKSKLVSQERKREQELIGMFEGKVALITGGSSGIGRASALAFAREGAKVVIADVNIKGGQDTMQMIKKAGGEAIFVKADVSKAAEVEALINKAVESYGRLDYAHNNAGVIGMEPLLADGTEEQWDRIINIDLKGVWLCMKYEIPQMVKQGGGSIVNTSSITGLVGGKHLPVYTACKHGVIGLTRVAGGDYAREGIRINAVCPGLILTPPLEQILKDEPRTDAEKQPIGRMGKPEEVAEAVVWLCSDAASFIIGTNLTMDGGLLAVV